MKSIIKHLALFSGLVSFLNVSCTKNDIQEYKVPLLKDAEITLDGQRNEAIWNNSLKISEFINPWHENVNPATSVELLYNGNDLYFYFEATDDEVVIKDNYTNKMDVCDEDRVEMFFSKDLSLSCYYGFEMDPEGRILDYQASLYRKFNYDWKAGDGIQIISRQTSTGYAVEGCITGKLLDYMTDKKKSFYWGAYRAEYSRDKEGKLVDRWQCLRNPKTPSPDFHLPESFNKLQLGD